MVVVLSNFNDFHIANQFLDIDATDTVRGEEAIDCKRRGRLYKIFNIYQKEKMMYRNMSMMLWR